MRIKFLLSFVVGFLLSMVAYGQTTWRGTNSDIISVAANWSNNLPSLSNVGTIDACVSCPVGRRVPRLSASWTFTGTTINITAGGNINLNGKTLTLTTGTLNISTSGTLSNNTVNDAIRVDNVNITNSNLNFGTVRIISAINLNISGASTLNLGSGVGTVTNLNISGVSTLNSGTALLTVTNLSLSTNSILNLDNIKILTVLNVDASVVNLSNNFSSNAAVNVLGGGNIKLNGFVLELLRATGILNISNSITFISGEIRATTLNISNASTFNSGSATITAATLNISNASAFNSGSAVITATTLNVSNNSILNSGAGLLTATTLNVLSGSTLNVTNVQVVTTLNVNGGIVNLNNNFSSNATVNVLGGGNIKLNGFVLELLRATGILNISNSITFISGEIRATTLNISNASTFNSGSAVITATTLNISDNSILNSGAGLLTATTLNILSGSTLNIVNVQVITTLNVNNSTLTFPITPISFTTPTFLVSNNATINLNNSTLNATVALNISQTIINSDNISNGTLITNNLSEMKESIFNGNIKISALSGSAAGGNTFRGTLDVELRSGATGNLSLNMSKSSLYEATSTFTNASVANRTLIIASHNNSTITTFGNIATFNNTAAGTLNIAINGAVIRANNDMIIKNNQNSFRLATVTAKVTGTRLLLENGGTTNLLSDNAMATFNEVSFINTSSNSSIITAVIRAFPITTNQLNISDRLSIAFASGVTNTISLNKVVCGIFVNPVVIDVSPSATLNITNSTFNDLSINQKSINPIALTSITCKGDFTLSDTGRGNVTFTNNNTFAKNLTFNRQAIMTAATIILNGTVNQSFLSTNSLLGVLSIFKLNLGLKTNGETIIGVSSNNFVNISITNELTLGRILNTVSMDLTKPRLHIVNGASITGFTNDADNKSYIVGAVKKTGFVINTGFIFPIGASKYVPMTFSPSATTTKSITAVYLLPPTTVRPAPINVIFNQCEYWSFMSDYPGSAIISLGFASNFCSTRGGNVDGLETFIWKSVAPWLNVPNTGLNNRINITSAISFTNATINEIALGYESLLHLDLSEVATKGFSFSTDGNITNIDVDDRRSGGGGGVYDVSVSPKFVGGASRGLLKLNFPSRITPIPAGVIPSTITINLINVGLLNTTQIANTNNDVNIEVNGQTTPLKDFYTITNTSSAEATIKFYKIPQITPTTALTITSNLVDGIKLPTTNLTFNFSAVASQPQFRLDIVDNIGTLVATNITTIAPNLTLTWAAPVALAPGTYKFVLKDLSSLKEYNGQFIKQ